MTPRSIVVGAGDGAVAHARHSGGLATVRRMRVRPICRRSLSRLALCGAVASMLSGCPTTEQPEVPPGPDLTEEGCHPVQGRLLLHASMDTLVLDYGATAIWAYEQDSVIWRGDFPQDGILAQREYTLHRQAFPQQYTLCLPPGRYLIRAIIDLNHNGWVCERGELWGAIVDYLHPGAAEDDLDLVLNRLVVESSGCLGEQTVPNTSE